MQSLSINEEKSIIGGASVKVSAAMITAVIRGVTTLFGLGKTLGSALRNIKSKTYCK